MKKFLCINKKGLLAFCLILIQQISFAQFFGGQILPSSGIPNQTILFSSMTKDSGLSTTANINADWTTADSSNGRLVTGTLSKQLRGGEKVEVYSNNGTSSLFIGYATVVGKSWVIVDHNGYAGATRTVNGVSGSGWIYTAKVVNILGKKGLETERVVTTITNGANTSLSTTTTTTTTTTGQRITDAFTVTGALEGFYDANGYRVEYNIWGTPNTRVVKFQAVGYTFDYVRFYYFDMQTQNKTVTFYDAANTVIKTQVLPVIPSGVWGKFFDSGTLTRQASYFTITGGDYDYYTIYSTDVRRTSTTTTTVNSTQNADTFTYQTGSIDMLGGDDVITASNTNLQSTLSTSGNYINGNSGVDTLVLLAGTTLNLTSLTGNQTVKPLQEIEVLRLQGTSTLTMSANSVLSLGGSNATTMSAFTFSSTTGGTASANSTGKVQLVVNTTATDTLNLSTLATDGVTTNGVLGNTGLAGSWSFMGTSTINSVSYKVYNHSTTQAQVLVSGAGTINL